MRCAIKHRRHWAIIPCCVFAADFPDRTLPATLKQPPVDGACMSHDLLFHLSYLQHQSTSFVFFTSTASVSSSLISTFRRAGGSEAGQLVRRSRGIPDRRWERSGEPLSLDLRPPIETTCLSLGPRRFGLLILLLCACILLLLFCTVSAQFLFHFGDDFGLTWCEMCVQARSESEKVQRGFLPFIGKNQVLWQKFE